MNTGGKTVFFILLLSLFTNCPGRKPCPDGIKGSQITVKKILARLERFGRFMRPTRYETAPVKVAYTLTPIYAIGFNPKTYVLTLNVWEKRTWVNPYLVWRNVCDVSLRIPLKRMWIPDVVVTNDLNQLPFKAGENAAVYHDGTVLWVTKSNIQIPCERRSLVDYDCRIKVASWTYSEDKISIKNGGFNMVSFKNQHHLNITKSISKKNKIRTKDGEVFADLEYNLKLKLKE